MAYRIRCVLGILIGGSYVLGAICWVSARWFAPDPPEQFSLSAGSAYFLAIIPIGLWLALAVVFLVEMMNEGRRRR